MSASNAQEVSLSGLSAVRESSPFRREPLEIGSVSTPPTASEVSISLSREALLKITPGTEPEKIKDIVNATKRNSFTQTAGLSTNEKVFFDNQYRKIARRYYMEAGDVAIKVFDDFYPVALAAALKLVKDDKEGTFQGSQASGSSQFLLRPIVPDSLGVDETNLEQTTGGTNRVNNYIDEVTLSTNKAEDEQEVLIFGHIMTTDPTVVVSGIDEIDDTIGERSEVGIQTTFGTSDSNLAPRENVVYLQNGDTYNLDLIAAKDETTDIFPFGVDIITESQTGP